MTSMRRRLVASLILALLIGVTGGAALAAAAGARRTATAYPRMVKATGSDGVLVSAFGPGLLGLYDEIERLPAVRTAGKLAAITVSPVSPSGEVPLVAAIAFASVDGRAGYSVAGFKVLRGRLPDPNAINEVLVNTATAARQGFHAGQHITMRLFRGGTPKNPHHALPTEGIPIDFTITGVGIAAEEVVPVAPLDKEQKMLLTPAFWKRYGIPNDTAFDGVYVRLRPRTNLSTFQHDIEAIAAKHQEAGGGVLMSVQAEHYARVNRAIRPQAAALALFAIVSALVSLLVLGQALSRQLALDASEYPALRALGATRGQLVGSALIRAALISGAGAIVAVILAVATSGLMPIGPARAAEPHPGFAVNVATLAIGGAVIVVAFVAWALLPALHEVSRNRVAGELHPYRNPSRIAAIMRRLPPAAHNGVRMALERGTGRTAVPVRGALIGTALAVAALVGSLVFGSALSAMVSTPRSFGWNWDVMLDTQFGVLPTSLLKETLDVDGVSAWEGGVYGSVLLRGRLIPAVGLDSGRGTVYPTLLEGRPARTANEIVLGPKTLREAHAKLGDTIPVTITKFDPSANQNANMRIVGVAVFPSLGRGSFTPTGLGDGAVTTAKPLEPRFAEEQGGETSSDLYSFALVRFRPGHSSLTATLRRAILASHACDDQDCDALAFRAGRPADIRNYARVQGTQVALAALLFGLAALTVGHTLVTAVRRRYAEIAMLRTLGFLRRGLSAMVAWQASTYALIACAIGIPAGIALGRWAWTLFADEVGVPPDLHVPAITILLPLVATFVLANAAAALPARSAGRVRPATVLRSE